MLRESPASQRTLHEIRHQADLAVIGGGLAGTCCAITAARTGLKVVLIHDRPVLGGNASSEVRLWVLGATCHMGSNNRWAREGGVIDEILLENLWRNSEGNSLIFDSILLEKVAQEKNLTVLLNTACYEVEKAPENPNRITGVKAYCSQNETLYHVDAPFFCDSSGDGVVGFLAGAAFRMGAESKSEFGEEFAPSGEFGYLLGHSMYFYTKDIGKPVKFVPPAFALDDIETKIPRYKQFNTKLQGCTLWWIEWGGRLDTIHETENIKWQLWKVVYGVWNYIKNSGKFPEAENLTLEWMGHIPGKRESRRFEGDYILKQQDVVERREHPDAVAYGGWSIDLHPADGVFAEIAGSHHLHSKGVYQIPYRCYYSRNIENLFMAGRIISSSHVAFGSTRVMGTCSLGGQAIAHAAKLCLENGELPRDINRPERMEMLQRRLLRDGHYIPRVIRPDPEDLAQKAQITATSTLVLGELPISETKLPLTRPIAQMIPLPAGRVPTFTVWLDAPQDIEFEVALRTSSDQWHHSPDVILATRKVTLKAGEGRELKIDFDAHTTRPGYVFLCLPALTDVSICTSDVRITGLVRLTFRRMEQTAHIGGENYEVYCPERRPAGQNFAMKIEPPVQVFEPENVVNGGLRPTYTANAWVGELGASNPTLELAWETPQSISEVILAFDPDHDHGMESVLYIHGEQAVVFCVKKYELVDDQGNIVAAADDNHQSHVVHTLSTPVTTSKLSLRVLETWGAPAAVFEVRCYS